MNFDCKLFSVYWSYLKNNEELILKNKFAYLEYIDFSWKLTAYCRHVFNYEQGLMAYQL